MSDFHYGGQAVLEGVMMRGERNMSVAVRAPNGQIVTHQEALDSRIYTSRWSKLPLARGLIMLWDTLALGFRALSFSANVALEEEKVELTGGMMWGSLILSLGFVVAFFFLVPLFLVGLVDRYVTSALLSNLVEGLVRLGLFLGYLIGIGFLPDIRRVFAYHGAEHKTVNAYEAGATLEPASVAQFSTAHTRCGTSFLLVVIVIFFFLTTLMGRPPLLLRLASRVILVPLVAAIAYEWLRFSAAHYDHPLIRALAAPGLALQRLTTREPNPDMVEVAVVALQQVRQADAAKAPLPLSA
jgi:uncharacterized protein YqhQ